MFGDSSTIFNVHQLLAKRADRLDKLENTFLNSFRYLMNRNGGTLKVQEAETNDVEAIDGATAEKRKSYYGYDVVFEDELRKDLAVTEETKELRRQSYDRDCVVLDMEFASELNTNNNGDFHQEFYDCEEATNTEMNILQLPVQSLLQIFTFLDVQDITSISSTCCQFNSLCADQILWRDFLRKDALLWQEVDHRSNPAMYEAANSDLTYKEIYMRCSPQSPPPRESSGFNLHKLPQLLWSFIPHKPPKVVMFGPGLESNTSTIVRKFLGGESNHTFKVRGVFPAQLPGVGSGFNVSMNDKIDVRLITLYSGTRRDRENRTADGRGAERNRLLQVVSGSRGEEEAELVEYEPTPTIKDLCGTVDAFIFVVDASADLKTGAEGQTELFALMNCRWTSHKCPLVILSCIPGNNVPRVPCVTVAKQLELSKLKRAWKMFDVNVADLSGVVEAITWLVKTAQGS